MSVADGALTSHTQRADLTRKQLPKPRQDSQNEDLPLQGHPPQCQHHEGPSFIASVTTPPRSKPVTPIPSTPLNQAVTLGSSTIWWDLSPFREYLTQSHPQDRSPAVHSEELSQVNHGGDPLRGASSDNLAVGSSYSENDPLGIQGLHTADMPPSQLQAWGERLKVHFTEISNHRETLIAFQKEIEVTKITVDDGEVIRERDSLRLENAELHEKVQNHVRQCKHLEQVVQRFEKSVLDRQAIFTDIRNPADNIRNSEFDFSHPPPAKQVSPDAVPPISSGSMHDSAAGGSCSEDSLMVSVHLDESVHVRQQTPPSQVAGPSSELRESIDHQGHHQHQDFAAGVRRPAANSSVVSSYSGRSHNEDGGPLDQRNQPHYQYMVNARTPHPPANTDSRGLHQHPPSRYKVAPQYPNYPHIPQGNSYAASHQPSQLPHPEVVPQYPYYSQPHIPQCYPYMSGHQPSVPQFPGHEVGMRCPNYIYSQWPHGYPYVSGNQPSILQLSHHHCELPQGYPGYPAIVQPSRQDERHPYLVDHQCSVAQSFQDEKGESQLTDGQLSLASTEKAEPVRKAKKGKERAVVSQNNDGFAEGSKMHKPRV
ncbi:hypothetical protein JAAARDRAFT_197558 [Jaapia argillacea MUCL 33604]|uniref:Uncharacterized protein n=1 Tax=Jaapia argillacea MUCL 33604 TaxID=933084 RepID=A0A067PHV0_9AGAM|nr:hypothetical protein JAAARDRAFT_197558 [Jaapia argillacea MUCL 33604]